MCPRSRYNGQEKEENQQNTVDGLRRVEVRALLFVIGSDNYYKDRFKYSSQPNSIRLVNVYIIHVKVLVMRKKEYIIVIKI